MVETGLRRGRLWTVWDQVRITFNLYNQSCQGQADSSVNSIKDVSESCIKL